MFELKIGKILSVNGLKVKVKLDKLLPPYLINNGKVFNSPKINSYVKTKVGLFDIICQVIGEENYLILDTIDKHEKPDIYYLYLNVIGCIENGKFIQGIRYLPIVNANVFTISEKELSIIYSLDSNSAIILGYNLFEPTRLFGLPLNDIIPSHIGVFGNTGSGKSNTLAKIYNEYISRFLLKNNRNNAKVILFDLNNEYGGNSIVEENYKKVYKLSTRKSNDKLPINYNLLTEDDFIILLNATKKMQAPIIKRVFSKINQELDVEDYYHELDNIIDNRLVNIFTSIRYNLSDYICGLEYFQTYTSQTEKNIYINTKSKYKDMKIRDFVKIKIPNNYLDKFLFLLAFQISKENSSGINSDYLIPLLNRCKKLIDNFDKVFIEDNNNFLDSKLSIIQLADCNEDMVCIIPSIVSKLLLDKAIENKGNNKIPNEITNIVIDEAHNILYDVDDYESYHKTTIDVFEKIVKEGRKFGVFLTLSSQRPADISNTILSQLHNYFIHKLVNPNDLAKIRNCVAYLDANTLDFLTVLSPGECIVSGSAVQLPQFIKVSMLENNAPNSDNVKLIGLGGILDMN